VNNFEHPLKSLFEHPYNIHITSMKVPNYRPFWAVFLVAVLRCPAALRRLGCGRQRYGGKDHREDHSGSNRELGGNHSAIVKIH